MTELEVIDYTGPSKEFIFQGECIHHEFHHVVIRCLIFFSCFQHWLYFVESLSCSMLISFFIKESVNLPSPPSFLVFHIPEPSSHSFLEMTNTLALDD